MTLMTQHMDGLMIVIYYSKKKKNQSKISKGFEKVHMAKSGGNQTQTFKAPLPVELY